MDDRESMNILKDILQIKMEDPLAQWGSAERNWIHTDKPLLSAKYPRIQISKVAPTTINIISCGFNYWEQRFVPIRIWFYTKTEFKWSYGEETLVDEELCKHYGEVIQNTIKDNAEDIKFEHGIYFKVTDIGEPVPDEDGQFYVVPVSATIMYFKK